MQRGANGLDLESIAKSALVTNQVSFLSAARKPCSLTEASILAALGKNRVPRPLAIERVLGRLNQAIDVLDSVTTRDRLFQRIAFLGTLERDLAYIWRAWNNGQSKPLTDEERRAAAAAGVYKSGDQVIAESALYLRTGDGPNAASIAEWLRELDLRLSRAP